MNPGLALRVRRRLVLWLDRLIVAAVLAMLVIELTGGFSLQLAGVRISGRSPDRALLAALALLAGRLLIERQTGFLGVSPTRWKTLWRRWHQPAAPAAARPLTVPDLIAAAAIIAVIGTALLHEQLRDLYAVPDLGDPLFSMWRLGWVARQLQGDARALFDANIFHPERLTLTYSDSMLLPGLTAAPLFHAGLHPVVIYNLVFLSGFFLSGVATFLLVRRLTGCTPAAIVAGIVYAFYPYRFEHYSHLELQMTHWMPLGLLAVHRFIDTLRVRDLLLAAGCAVAQLYSSMYYGLFFVMYAAVVAGVLVRARSTPWRRLALPVLAVSAAGVLLALPLARPYLAAQARKGSRDVPAVRVYSATASDYLHAHERSARYGALLSGGQPERELFPGLAPLALTAAALIPPVGTTTLAYLAGLALAFDGSLGMNGLLYPYLYDWFLPIRGLRVPARFSVLVGLSLAVLAGYGVQRLIRRVPRWRGHAVVAVVLLLTAADLQPALSLQPVWQQPPAMYAALGGGMAPRATAQGVVLAEFPQPPAADLLHLNLPFMYFSIWHGLPLVNGYSGFAPPEYDELIAGLQQFPDARSLRLLRHRGATHVTLNCALHGPGCEETRAAWDASPELRLTDEGEWEGQPTIAYELVRP